MNKSWNNEIIANGFNESTQKINIHEDDNYYSDLDDNSPTPYPTQNEIITTTDNKDQNEVIERKYEDNDITEIVDKQHVSAIIDKFKKDKANINLYSLDCLNEIKFGGNVLMINEKPRFHVIIDDIKYKFCVNTNVTKAGNMMIQYNDSEEDGIELKLNLSIMVCTNSMDKGENIIYNLFNICLLSLNNKIIMVNDIQLRNKYSNHIRMNSLDGLMVNFLQFMNSEKDDKLFDNKYHKYVRVITDKFRFISGYAYYWLTD